MGHSAQPHRPAISTSKLLGRLPPQSFFLVSAVFHSLGPSLAVLLFARVDVLGVAWLRMASGAALFAVWRRPWRLLARMGTRERWVLVQLGVVIAAMNCVFYLAVARLPLSTVGAVEFLATVLLATFGARTIRNVAALVLTGCGVVTITDLRITGEPLGFVFAFANCALFIVYVILGHRIANTEQVAAWGARDHMAGIDRLAAAMVIAAVVVTPVGFAGAVPGFTHPGLLLAGVGVGVCSSVIPYVTDQLAMARLPRATFALMLALLPMFAVIIGAAVLNQIPTTQDLVGIALVVAGVAMHQVPSPDTEPEQRKG